MKGKTIKEILPGVRENVFLKDYTTYKIGGPAKYFFVVEKNEDVVEAVKIAKGLKLPIFILGGGSNILVSDKGFPGLVVKLQNYSLKTEGNKVYVDAGVGLTELARFTAENGFHGMEWAAGIPGATVGGAIYGHAQAFGFKTSDFLESVEALDIKTFKLKNFSKEQCRFSLKNSIFKKRKNLVIISAVFSFEKGDKEKIKEKVQNNIYHRNTKHPMAMPSAGSTFVNPEVKIKNKKLIKLYPELAHFNEIGIIPAGFLIEKSGLAGKTSGKAKISEKHSNFIVNLGGATAKDILALIKITRAKVKKVFGINLETEVQLVGF